MFHIAKKICWNAACYTICGISLKISLTARDKRLNKLLQNLEEYLLVSYFSEQDNLYFTVFFLGRGIYKNLPQRTTYELIEEITSYSSHAF